MEKGRQLAIAAGVAVGAWQGHKPGGQLGWGSQYWLIAPGPGAALEGSLAEAWTGGQVQMALDLAKLCPGSPHYRSLGEKPLPWLWIGLCCRLRQASAPQWDQDDVLRAVSWVVPGVVFLLFCSWIL